MLTMAILERATTAEGQAATNTEEQCQVIEGRGKQACLPRIRACRSVVVSEEEESKRGDGRDLCYEIRD